MRAGSRADTLFTALATKLYKVLEVPYTSEEVLRQLLRVPASRRTTTTLPSGDRGRQGHGTAREVKRSALKHSKIGLASGGTVLQWGEICPAMLLMERWPVAARGLDSTSTSKAVRLGIVSRSQTRTPLRLNLRHDGDWQSEAGWLLLRLRRMCLSCY